MSIDKIGYGWADMFRYGTLRSDGCGRVGLGSLVQACFDQLGQGMVGFDSVGQLSSGTAGMWYGEMRFATLRCDGAGELR